MENNVFLIDLGVHLGYDLVIFNGDSQQVYSIERDSLRNIKSNPSLYFDKFLSELYTKIEKIDGTENFIKADLSYSLYKVLILGENNFNWGDYQEYLRQKKEEEYIKNLPNISDIILKLKKTIKEIGDKIYKEDLKNTIILLKILIYIYFIELDTQVIEALVLYNKSLIYSKEILDKQLEIKKANLEYYKKFGTFTEKAVEYYKYFFK